MASDGCGHHDVLVASGESGPGYPMSSSNAIGDPMRTDGVGADFAVALDPWSFLEGLLQQDIEDSGRIDRRGSVAQWPFDRAQVTSRDPAILDVVGVPLPWDAP